MRGFLAEASKPSTGGQDGRRDPWRAVWVGAVYALLAVASLSVHDDDHTVSGHWLATPVAVVILIAIPRRDRFVVAITIAAVAFAIDAIAKPSILLALQLTVLNTAQTVMSALLVTVLLPLERVRRRGGDAAVFGLAVAAAAILVPALCAVGAGGLDPGGFMAGWSHWWAETSLWSLLVLSLYLTGRHGQAVEVMRPATLLRFSTLLILSLATAAFALRTLDSPLIVVQLPLLAAAALLPPFGTALIAALVATGMALLSPFGLAGLHGEIVLEGFEYLVGLQLVVFGPMVLALAVNELRQNRLRFEASEERFRRLVDDAAVGRALVDRNGWIRDANLSLASMIGTPLIGRRFEEAVHPGDRAQGLAGFEAVLAGRVASHGLEQRMLRSDGSAFTARVTVTGETDSGGTAFGLIVQVEDITDRKRTESQLAEAEERWQFALENSGQGVWDHDLVAGRSFLSARWKAIVGYADHELQATQETWVEIIHPDDREAALADDLALREGTLPVFDREMRVQHKDGRWIWVRNRGKVVARDASGRALRMIGTHVDVTDEREAKAARDRLVERVRMATDNAGVGLFEISGRGRTVWWSERMHALHGTDPARFLPSMEAWAQLIHPADLPRVRREAMRAFAGRRMFDTEYRIVAPDEGVRIIRAFARRREDDPSTLIGTNWDVTAEREAVGRLRLANAHIEQFATVVSHDLQAPLRQIALWADILRRDAAERLEPADVDIVDRIQRRARQMRRMIVGLLEFSRAGADIELVPVDLVRVATEAVSDYAAELGTIAGSVVIEPIPRALGDPLMVAQIFGNLISNAIKYRGSEPLQIVLNGWEEPGAIVVSVRDNGRGIDPVYADAVFELFRRLPEAVTREGSGVGLAVCQRMAAAMGGSISLDTSVGSGSMFVLRLRPVHGTRQVGSADAARSPVS